MRILLLTPFVISFAIVSCKEKTASPLFDASSTLLPKVPVEADEILGTYEGDLKGSPVALTVHYFGSGHVSGYDFHEGIKRNLSGTVTLEGRQLHFHVKEPGTYSRDGVFDLFIDTLTWMGNCMWKPLKDGEESSFFIKKIRSEDNTANFFETVFVDSLGNSFELMKDGSCTYNFMYGDSVTAQKQVVRGNYRFKQDSTIAVFWQKNEFLPSKISNFRWHALPMDENYQSFSIEGEGHLFQEMED